MAVQERLYTADDLWEISHQDDAQRYELYEGELIEMSPTGDFHGVVAAWVLFLILSFVDAHDLGEVTAAETGYIVSTNPDTLLAPDVGFIAKAQFTPLTGKYYRIAPDMAVEVVSPNDKAFQIHRKVKKYLKAGTHLVWIVYPEDRTVDVYRPDHDMVTVEGEGILDGFDILPALKLTANEVFKKLR